MKARYHVSRNAIELIKRFEGYRANSAQMADGRWTIGYGHTLTAREGAKVSADDAEALLMYDLIAVAHAVNEHSYTPLTQNQFDALTSFAFNIGVENFRRSAVLRRINEGALIQAACAMDMWRKADFAGERIVIDALVRRRSAEKTLFLTPPDGWVAAPSPILPPKVDYDASYSVPRQAPAAIVTPLEGVRAEAHRDEGPLPVPVPPDEDAVPTESERAAAAVSARLEALLPDDGPAAEPVLAAPPPAEAGAFDLPPMPEAPPEAPQGDVAQPEAQTTPAAAWPSPFVAPTLEEQTLLDAEASLPEDINPQPEPSVDLDPPVAVEPPAQAEPHPVSSALDTMTIREDTLFDPPPTMVGPESAPFNLKDGGGVVASFDPAFPLETAKPGSTKAAPLAALAVGSLVLFAGGVFGGLNAASDNSGALLTAKAISWMLCVIGAVGVIAAMYLLLRLLDRDDD
jgi:lysozyme